MLRFTVPLVSLVFLLVLQPLGIRSETVHRFSRAGEDVTLPCEQLQERGPTCSDVDWFHYKDRSSTPATKVSEGQIKDRSRFSLNSDCSLSLQNITVDDSGLFFCRFHNRDDLDTKVYLSIITVSLHSSEQDSTSLQCRLLTFRKDTCEDGMFHWFEQNEKISSEKREDCVSHLTVEHQSQPDRTFTCQFEDRNKGDISAQFTLKGNKKISTTPGVSEEIDTIYIIIGAVVSLLVLLVVAALVFFKIKSKSSAAQTTARPQVSFVDERRTDQPTELDPEGGVTYAMINHQQPRGNKKVPVEDSVTYSAVSLRTTDDSSSSAVYSTVNKTKPKPNSSDGRTIG